MGGEGEVLQEGSVRWIERYCFQLIRLLFGDLGQAAYALHRPTVFRRQGTDDVKNLD
jgi:hypothetical protein